VHKRVQTAKGFDDFMSGTKVTNFFHSELRQIDSLRRRNPDPLVEIHPETAASLGIAEGDWVWIESPIASVRAGAIHELVRLLNGESRLKRLQDLLHIRRMVH
jgi:anaerobic selenocysteine-containing dehydrogenase